MKHYPFEANKEDRGYKKKIERRFSQRRSSENRNRNQNEWQFEDDYFDRDDR